MSQGENRQSRVGAQPAPGVMGAQRAHRLDSDAPLNVVGQPPRSQIRHGGPFLVHGPRFPYSWLMNRLANETSPYLLQHAGNPVDWYPWGEEALERARAEDLPILLSVGYSACHWCHVMERESFEDEATAEFMNRHFVNVKVDREERPDVDAIYMKAVQALTGHGGWPLTAFLTPAGEPYYGGTYFPPEPRHGMPAFRQVLEATAQAYRHRPDEVARAAGELRTLLERSSAPPSADGGPAPDAALLDRAFRAIAGQFDPINGGFGGAPKFPQPVVLDFLLRYHRRTGNEHALVMARHTLVGIARGGMRDQLDGGFHRYSVDARWLVPHFEKMLYDNALLTRAYVHAYQLTGDEDLRIAAAEGLDYVLSDLGAAEGGFFSARDADSEGEEGLFYVWTPAQVEDVLGEERARLFSRVYDVSDGGNFEGNNILHVPHDLEAVARSEGISLEEVSTALARDRAALLEARGSRIPPLLDDKILTGWNGIMIRTLAEAGGALSHPPYLDAACAGARFLLDTLRFDDRLLHTFKDGRARIGGFLEDYGALGNALLTLHEVTLDPTWLDEARWVGSRILDLFLDRETGTLYDTASDEERLLIRPREVTDNATPSGTALAVELFLRAAVVFNDEEYRTVALGVLTSEAATVERYPLAFGRLLSCVEILEAGAVEVAIVGPGDAPATRELLAVVLGRYLPNRVVVGGPGGDADGSRGIPLLVGRTMRDGLPTAYVCRNYACREPVTGAEALRHLLP